MTAVAVLVSGDGRGGDCARAGAGGRGRRRACMSCPSTFHHRRCPMSRVMPFRPCWRRACLRRGGVWIRTCQRHCTGYTTHTSAAMWRPGRLLLSSRCCSDGCLNVTHRTSNSIAHHHTSCTTRSAGTSVVLLVVGQRPDARLSQPRLSNHIIPMCRKNVQHFPRRQRRHELRSANHQYKSGV